MLLTGQEHFEILPLMTRPNAATLLRAMAKSVPIHGEKFRRIWEQSKLSGDTFAQRLGMKRSNLTRLTRSGRQGMGGDLFERVAKYVGVSVERLEKMIGASALPPVELRSPKVSPDLVNRLTALAGRWGRNLQETFDVVIVTGLHYAERPEFTESLFTDAVDHVQDPAAAVRERIGRRAAETRGTQ